MQNLTLVVRAKYGKERKWRLKRSKDQVETVGAQSPTVCHVMELRLRPPWNRRKPKETGETNHQRKTICDKLGYKSEIPITVSYWWCKHRKRKKIKDFIEITVWCVSIKQRNSIKSNIADKRLRKKFYNKNKEENKVCLRKILQKIFQYKKEERRGLMQGRYNSRKEKDEKAFERAKKKFEKKSTNKESIELFKKMWEIPNFKLKPLKYVPVVLRDMDRISFHGLYELIHQNSGINKRKMGAAIFREDKSMYTLMIEEKALGEHMTKVRGVSRIQILELEQVKEMKSEFAEINDLAGEEMFKANRKLYYDIKLLVDHIAAGNWEEVNDRIRPDNDYMNGFL